jgi:hypothetical protein
MATIKILIWHQTLLSRGILISDCLNFAGLILWLIILSNTFWKHLVVILNLSCLPYSIEEEFEDTKGVIRICKSKDRQHNCQQKKKTRILCFYSDACKSKTYLVIPAKFRQSETNIPLDSNIWCQIWIFFVRPYIEAQNSCFLFLLAIVLSVLRFTDSDYPFGIFKLFLLSRGIFVSDLLNFAGITK